MTSLPREVWTDHTKIWTPSLELYRCQLSETRVRSNLVELAPELLDQDLRIDPVLEPLHAEALVARLAVEAIRSARACLGRCKRCRSVPPSPSAGSLER